MKKVSLAILLSLSTISAGFSQVVKNEEVKQEKKLPIEKTENLMNFKDFEMEADYSLLKLSMELEKDFKHTYSER